MRDPLTVAVAQPACAAYDVAANALIHAAVVQAAQARVVVFPELSLTGYHLDAPALDPADPALLPLVQACAATGSLALVGAPIAGSGALGVRGEHTAMPTASGGLVASGEHTAMPTASGGLVASGDGTAMRAGIGGGEYIAVLAVDGSGVRVVYRKLHLGAEEAKRFVAGPAPVVLDVGGWRLGLAVCKDFNTPQHQADTVALGIDCYLAGTVKHDHEAAAQSDRASKLAAQHGMWVAVASCAGPSGSGFDRTAGCSGIWDRAGNAVARTGPEVGGLVRATVA